LTATTPVTSNNATAVAISGTAEVGATVEVRVIGGESGSEVVVGPISAAVAGDGTWSLSGIDVSTLPDGPIRYEVKMTDTAGNNTTISQDAQKDTATTLSITTADGSAVSSDNAAAFPLFGHRELMASILITVTDGSNSVTATLPPASTGWFKSLDLTTLADGTLTVTVEATDNVGNTATASIELQKDTQAVALGLGDQSMAPVWMKNQDPSDQGFL
jgi:hypothetical protein